MTDTVLTDPASLNGTELLLRQRYCPETLAASSPEAPQGLVMDDVLPAHQEALKASDMSAEELAEMIEVELRNQKLIELARQAQKNKGNK
ncbi:hypothetical protein [Pseudomonas glycinae]|uniref:hypothetical protein n=1 Tax=Pseudomonas glycinae TaxID=1785145 RepID=UPI001F38DCBE|nr:hypothetical protein [Pseudomonas glycinae]